MRSIWRTVDRSTGQAITVVCLADALVGASYGAASVAGGLPLWLPVALSLLVLAGASELLFTSMVAAGAGPFMAAFAGLLVNARHVPYGSAVSHLLGRGWRRALGLHLVNDETVAFGISADEVPERRARFWACGIGILAAWPLGTTMGALGAGALDNVAGLDSFGLGLDALFPALLMAVALPAVRDRDTGAAAAVGVTLTLACWAVLPPGFPYLVSILGLAGPALLSRSRVRRGEQTRG